MSAKKCMPSAQEFSSPLKPSGYFANASIYDSIICQPKT